MNYKGYIIKPRVCYSTYKYSIFESDGVTYIGQARNLKEAKQWVRCHIENMKLKQLATNGQL